MRASYTEAKDFGIVPETLACFFRKALADTPVMGQSDISSHVRRGTNRRNKHAGMVGTQDRSVDSEG